MLMKSSPEKKKKAGALEDGGVAMVSDAGAVTPPPAIDAPEVAMYEMTIESEPKGAEVTINGELKGKTPIKLPFVLVSKEVTGSMVLNGYDEASFSFNPIERQKQNANVFKVTLKRPKGGAAPVRLPKQGTGSGSGGTQAKPPNDNTNPDWSKNPYTGGGNVPPKK
jgi:hypothetical protein